VQRSEYRAPGHVLVGLGGERQCRLRQLLARLERQHVGAFLIGVGQRKVVGAGKLAVAVRTLDSVRLTPDFVKIDVEGAEDRVIAGASETLRRCSPLIMAENSYPERVRAALASFGYAPFNFDPARGLLYPQDRALQNSFYVDERWAERLRRAGLLSMDRGASFSDAAMGCWPRSA
jgi:hypothetical protein